MSEYPDNFPEELKSDIALAALKVDARKKALMPEDGVVDHDSMRPLLVGLDLNGEKLMGLATATAIHCAIGMSQLVGNGEMSPGTLIFQVGKGQWVDGVLTGLLLAEQRALDAHVDVARQLSETYSRGYEAGIAEGLARAEASKLREGLRP